MKKILLFCVFLVSIGSFSWGQGLSAGLEGGGNLRWLWGNQNISQSNLGGAWASAVWFRFDFQDFIGLQVGIGSERKGSVFNATGIGIPNVNAIHNNLDYAVVPVLLNVYVTPQRRLYFQAGSFVGFLTGAHEVNYGGDTPQSFDTRQNFKALDAGTCLGAGYRIVDSGNFSLFAQARANLGLVNVSALPVVSGGTLKTFTTDFRVGMSYRFAQNN